MVFINKISSTNKSILNENIHLLIKKKLKKYLTLINVFKYLNISSVGSSFNPYEMFLLRHKVCLYLPSWFQRSEL